MIDVVPTRFGSASVELDGGPVVIERDELGAPRRLFWRWLLQRRDAFGEWQALLDVETSAAGLILDVTRDGSRLWPFDDAAIARCLADQLQRELASLELLALPDVER